MTSSSRHTKSWSPLHALLALAIAAASGCAHTINIESTPPGAAVLVEGELVGRTPVAVPETTGRDDLVSVEVERDGRTAHFAYQKTGVSTDAVAGAALSACGMCAAGAMGIGGFAALLFPATLLLGTAPLVGAGLIVAAYATYAVGLLLVTFSPYVLVLGVGEGARQGPERIHVDFTSSSALVTSTPNGMTVPLVGRTMPVRPAQRY